MEIRKPKAMHDFENVISGSDVVTSKKLYKDAASFYKQKDPAMSKDTLMYEVYQYTGGKLYSKDVLCTQNKDKAGDLNWGLTVLYPVTVMQECNMTRGHWHENQACAEFYLGVEGTGLLMLMDHDGTTWCEEICKGSLHYIDGTLAHRLINTGDTVCKVAACWPKDAGHDYAAVEKQPFGYRVMKQHGELKIEKVEETYEK